VETGGILVFIMLLWYNKTHWPWLLAASGAAAILIAIFPLFFYPVAALLLLIGKGLGRISSAIILTLVFFLFVVPVGLIRRLLKKDSLKLNAFKRNKDSVFSERQYVYRSSDLDHLF
jgi:polyferredoxin